ncbi:MAG: TRIC cation channel family protein [Candidatus Bathyarchaeota archaeon]|nr:TRIC cation channel family protein [Candidatus Bathyarchaeota archaeon]
MIAASTNAFAGALLARRPDHYKGYTRIGIVLLAVIAGIGGGVVRDIILNQVPAAFTNPLYVILCTIMGVLALTISYRAGRKTYRKRSEEGNNVKEGALNYMATFSLPWYAAVGVDKALTAGVPVFPAIIIGIIGPTTGRFIVDLTSGVTPKHFVKGEFFVTTAILTSIIYYLLYVAGLSIWPATLISVAFGFTFRTITWRKGWEEKEPWEPKSSLKVAKPKV